MAKKPRSVNVRAMARKCHGEEGPRPENVMTRKRQDQEMPLRGRATTRKCQDKEGSRPENAMARKGQDQEMP